MESERLELGRRRNHKGRDKNKNDGARGREESKSRGQWMLVAR
jgi:hypothetical protein